MIFAADDCGIGITPVEHYCLSVSYGTCGRSGWVSSVTIGVHPRSLGAHLDSPWKDYEMRKGFTRKPKPDEPATPVKNYITRSGLERLRDEHRFLLTRERPAVTEYRQCDKWRVSGE